jgi:alpha-tubulin suppressor-like RCC1 family protein
LTGATSITAAGQSTCARKSDGTGWCWGRGTMGQIGNGGVVNVSTPQQVSGVTNFTRVYAGVYHGCGVLSDNTVACWGNNNRGQLGNGSQMNSPVPVAVLPF